MPVVNVDQAADEMLNPHHISAKPIPLLNFAYPMRMASDRTPSLSIGMKLHTLTDCNIAVSIHRSFSNRDKIYMSPKTTYT